VLDLYPLRRDAAAYSLLLGQVRKHFALSGEYFRFGNWYLRVGNRSYGQYLESLPSKLRNTVNRRTRQLRREPGFRMVVVTREQDLEWAAADYELVYRSSWKRPEPYPDFMKGLMRICAQQRCLRLGIAYLGERPVAAQLWIVFAGIASIYKLAYDESAATLSPGTVLTAHLMQHAIDIDRVSEVDYLVGDDAYKKEWMSDRRELWGIVAFNERTVRGLVHASTHSIGNLRRRLRLTPMPAPSQGAS
jgi:hypothetical protein